MPLLITTTEFVAGEARLVEELAEGRKEAVVLGPGPVADPDVPGAAERCARADRDPALGEAGDDPTLVGVAEVDPGEVRLGVRRRDAQVPQPLLDVEALDDRGLDPAQGVVGVEYRLRPRRLGKRVDAERL